MRKLTVRVIRAPRIIFCNCINRLIAPLWMRLNGVYIGSDCRFIGIPSIRIVPGASIHLGHSVHIYSSPNSNPIGLSHPTMLSAIESESFINIGDRTGISGASIVASCGVTIGKNVNIGAGVCIWDTDFHPISPVLRRKHQTRNASKKAIIIDDEVFVGAQAIILKGVTIGRQAVIGASSVVSKNVKPGEIVAGNPARVIGSI